ncbi:hypothetical protein EJ06DRAFT_503884 [Trichodelitschia bisporula]|uniref:F-box domain-containing protein n=1 Tax=Trichodelitschia bisporula TaxID=703511 RepID=A0A6G1I8Y3_9PEZI|nr:hypothetical protein EJ06DRAFT_503884 [Trichodelitschia bisporula]
MVLVVDLDEEHPPHDPHSDPHSPFGLDRLIKRHLALYNDSSAGADDNAPCPEADRPNLNVGGFSASLACYPFVSQLASLLDLNDLHSLASTCRQFRANLLQYRNQLVTQTLRCSNDAEPSGTQLAQRFRESHAVWRNGTASYTGRITTGKVSLCARDMVAECRRCGVVVCRNCTAKPPPLPALDNRHRRLCRTCLKAPLSAHTAPLRRHDVSPHSSPSTSPARLHRFPTPPESARPPAFTAPAFARMPCTCPDVMWLCNPCGRRLCKADTVYADGWAWRARYCANLGGLGTGIGEGMEGVECGRCDACFAARVVEKEMDCAITANSGHTGFDVQEMVGVGGLVKRKTKKLIYVGAEAMRYQDEGENMKSLERENRGEVRSWCAWCDRVIPSKADEEKLWVG